MQVWGSISDLLLEGGVTKSLEKYSKIKVLNQRSNCLFRWHKIEGRSVDSHFHFRIFIIFTLNMLNDTRNITSKQLHTRDVFFLISTALSPSYATVAHSWSFGGKKFNYKLNYKLPRKLKWTMDTFSVTRTSGVSQSSWALATFFLPLRY